MISSLEFFSLLKWIDGTPLIDTIEPYRRQLFTLALDTVGDDGLPSYNMVLAGRGKKNWKSADLVLAALYKLAVPEPPQGNDGFILANDEGQAGDDLSLAKKIVSANPDLESELESLQKEIRRRDGRGSLKILPARDAVGAHGKTGIFIGYDEIHSYRDYNLMEALAPDPTRQNCLVWITSYDSIFQTPGNPLFDLKQIGFAGTDPRMLFSWYSGDRCTDPDFVDLPPEQRANPSMASWAEREVYLEQQKRRLPTHKYRRLHLNLPGSPSGAFFDNGVILSSIDAGVKYREPNENIVYRGFCDLSGGSQDDAVLSIGHAEDKKLIQDLCIKQAGTPPFNPRDAVAKFAQALHHYGLTEVTGDRYAGLTFFFDFQALDITYRVSARTESENYEQLEPRINAGDVSLLDIPELHEQLISLVLRGSKVDHQSGGHSDWSAAAAGALNLAADLGTGPRISISTLPSSRFSGDSEWSRADLDALKICGRTFDGRTAADYYRHKPL